MRLAIISQQGDKASGAEHALMEFVRLLPSSVELSWFFFEDGDFARSIREKYSSVTIVAMSRRVAGVMRQQLAMTPLIDVVTLTWRLKRRLAATQPDVVLTNSMKAHVVGSFAAKLAGFPCINYVHDIVDGQALALLRFSSRLFSDERLTCSLAVKTKLALPRTTVSYAAIDVESFEYLPDRHTAREALGIPVDALSVVAIVGRIARWKRQDLFLEIAARVSRQADAYFCIIGSPVFGVDAEYLSELKQIVENHDLGKRVFFIPWQSDMRVVYAAMDVSCNCSVREPFGRTSLEALASGVPIVCFDDAGICEIFDQGHGGTHVAAGDVNGFADAVIKYLRNGARKEATSAVARRVARPLDARLAFPIFVDALNRVGARSKDPIDARVSVRSRTEEDAVATFGGGGFRQDRHAKVALSRTRHGDNGGRTV